MSPPIKNGFMLFNNFSFPYNTPIPSGANILCPENTTKSASKSCTSIFMWGMLWEASTITTAPFLCAYFIISFTLFIVPSTFDTCVIPTIFVLSVILLSISSFDNSNSSFIYMYFRLAPVFLVTYCHGTKSEWCSIIESTTSSSSFRLSKPYEYAIKFKLSLAFLENIISFAFLAFINFAIFSLVPSYTFVASMLREYAPLCGFALLCS